jgi:uncharacterized membrane protein YhaH (DUF805 family)
MLRVYFGEFASGRLGRLGYLGHYVGLTLAMVAVGLAVGFGAGVTEEVVGADTAAEATQPLSVVALVVLSILGVAAAVAGVNILAKRLRDIGLPGWWGAAGIFVAAAILAAVGGDSVSGLFGLVVFVVLVGVPTGALGRGRAGPIA